MIPVTWLLLALLIGFLGRNRILGFWAYFTLSFLLSPLVGALAVAVTRDAASRHA